MHNLKYNGEKISASTSSCFQLWDFFAVFRWSFTVVGLISSLSCESNCSPYKIKSILNEKVLIFDVCIVEFLCAHESLHVVIIQFYGIIAPFFNMVAIIRLFLIHSGYKMRI